MMGLTKRQSEALAFIRGFMVEKKFSPTFREIAIGLECSLPETHRLVHQLVDRGALGIMAGRARSLTIDVEAA